MESKEVNRGSKWMEVGESMAPSLNAFRFYGCCRQSFGYAIQAAFSGWRPAEAPSLCFFDFRRLGPPPHGTWCHVSIWVYIAKSGEGIRRVLGSDAGRSHYHEDKDILVAVELRGGLDPFRQGEESFCQRRVNTYGILQKRVGKTCEDQGPSLARLHLFFACHGLGFGASARP